MIDRFKILAEDVGREAPEVGEEVVFKVVATESSSLITLNLNVVVTAVDPQWGPGFARVEGFVKFGNSIRAVVGYHATEKKSHEYIGIIEVHFDET